MAGWPDPREKLGQAVSLARAVVVLDENGTVVHTELVPELTQEPNYDLAVHAIRNHHHPCPEDAAEGTE